MNDNDDGFILSYIYIYILQFILVLFYFCWWLVLTSEILMFNALSSHNVVYVPCFVFAFEYALPHISSFCYSMSMWHWPGWWDPNLSGGQSKNEIFDVNISGQWTIYCYHLSFIMVTHKRETLKINYWLKLNYKFSSFKPIENNNMMNCISEIEFFHMFSDNKLNLISLFLLPFVNEWCAAEALKQQVVNNNGFFSSVTVMLVNFGQRALKVTAHKQLSQLPQRKGPFNGDVRMDVIICYVVI